MKCEAPAPTNREDLLVPDAPARALRSRAAPPLVSWESERGPIGPCFDKGLRIGPGVELKLPNRTVP